MAEDQNAEDDKPRRVQRNRGVKLPPILKKKPAKKKPVKKAAKKKRSIRMPPGANGNPANMSVDKRFNYKLAEDEKPPSTAMVRRTIAKRTGVPTPTPKYQGMIKHDWPKIRAWFMEADMDTTLKDCAEYFDISYKMVGVRAGRERWIAQRVDYKAEQARRHYAKRTKRMQQGGEKFDDDTIRVADMGMSLVQARLGEIAQMYQAMSPQWQAALDRKQQGLPVEKEELWSSIRSSELLDLARSLQLFQEIGRKAFGTDILMQQIQISGPDGGPVELHETIDVANELGKEDPARLAKFMEVMERTGLLQGQLAITGDTVDGELIEDGGPNTDDEYTEANTTQDGATDQPDDQSIEDDDADGYVSHVDDRNAVWNRDKPDEDQPGEYTLE